MNKRKLLLAVALSFGAMLPLMGEQTIPDGFTSLFNGEDFTNWKYPAGHDGHWKVLDGVIDYDAMSEAEDKNLWTEKEYGDFVLMLDWRIKSTPFLNPNVFFIRPDGTQKKNFRGSNVRMSVPDSDSGVYIRGSRKAQINIWCWPVGSGEMWSYRTADDTPPEVRSAVTPREPADRDLGEWNTFVITMKGQRVTVVLNDVTIIEDALLPGIPERGPIGLQHHGRKNVEGEWILPPSLMQFRNIYIREL